MIITGSGRLVKKGEDRRMQGNNRVAGDVQDQLGPGWGHGNVQQQQQPGAAAHEHSPGPRHGPNIPGNAPNAVLQDLHTRLLKLTTWNIRGWTDNNKQLRKDVVQGEYSDKYDKNLTHLRGEEEIKIDN